MCAMVEVTDDFYQKIEPGIHRRIAHELRPARRIVELGCGDCNLARFLAKQKKDREVIGIDISDAQFPECPAMERLQCIKADARALDFLEEGTADAVVSAYSLHELVAPMSCLRAARRLLRPGGELVVVDFPKGSLAQRLWNERYYTTGKVAGMLRRAGFERVRSSRIERRQLTWAKAFTAGKREETR